MVKRQELALKRRLQTNPWQMNGIQEYVNDMMESTKEALGGQAPLPQARKQHLMQCHAQMYKGRPQEHNDIYEARAKSAMPMVAEKHQAELHRLKEQRQPRN